MYRRFLNDGDYLRAIGKEALLQMTRGDSDRCIEAEESAEISIIEHLSENYEIEAELSKGKYIADYERAITYPVGVHVYFEDKIYEVIRSISGYKSPSVIEYWDECFDANVPSENINNYSQFNTYYTNDIVCYNNALYKCLADNGYKFANIRIPMVRGWLEVDCQEWQPRVYDLWDVVSFDGEFYTLISLDDFDNNVNPYESENWGAIAEYSPAYNEYELSAHEYVVYDGYIFHPEIDVNADMPIVGVNLSLHDPRNYNLKKHMVRLALYELAKLIAPNNVSVIRVKDHEDSMKWLSNAAKLKLNPQIPRRLTDTKKEVMDWQLATFQAEYDPHKNPWMI